jgi:hypothetical protein
VEPLTKVVNVVWWREGSEDEPKREPITLRKWSGIKLLTLIKNVEDIAQALGENFTLDGFSAMGPIEVAKLIHSLGESAMRKAANLVAESVLKPKPITAEDVMSWDLDDFMTALIVMIEMNFAEGTRKNAGRLLAVAAEKVFATRQGATSLSPNEAAA